MTPLSKTPFTIRSVFFWAFLILPISIQAEPGAASKGLKGKPDKVVVPIELPKDGAQAIGSGQARSVSDQSHRGNARMVMGNERGNGGDAFVGPTGSVRFLDLVREPRAEILDPDVEGLTVGLTQEMSRHIGLRAATFLSPSPDLPISSSSVAHAIRSALDRLTFYLVPGPIPEVLDRGVVLLPWNLNGVIVRLALQDRQTGNVVVDRGLYEKLPLRDRVAFMMHETLIRLFNEDSTNSELASTEKIASFVNVLFNRTDHMPEGLSAKTVARYLCDVGYLISDRIDREAAPWKRSSGYLTPGHAYFPNKNVIVFRQSGRCFSALLRIDGPLTGSWVSRRGRDSVRLYNYEFREIGKDGVEYYAYVMLRFEKTGGASSGYSIDELSFQSDNPETPLIMADLKELSQFRFTVIGY
ncbi:MAG: hypothetical protein IT288_12725 [Bdellovibrionales bacterium]|nr:hypothetical protein [Bdellovibrionales bacterium]